MRLAQKSGLKEIASGSSIQKRGCRKGNPVVEKY